MIILFEGTPGAGKTYSAMVRIVENLMKGRTVYTNLEGQDDSGCRFATAKVSALFERLPEKLVFMKVKKEKTGKSDFEVTINGKSTKDFFEGLPDGAFVIFDEVQNYYSNRDWQAAKNREFAEYCSTHRHFGHDLILITQSIERLDSAVRALVEWTYRFRKVNFLGGMVSKSFLEYVYPQDEVGGEHLSRKVKQYDKKYFPCYKSYAGEEVKEVGVMKSTNILKHPVFLLLPVVLVIALYLLFGRSSMAKGDWFGAKSAMAQQKTVKAAAEPVAPVKAVAAQNEKAVKEEPKKELDQKERFLVEQYEIAKTKGNYRETRLVTDPKTGHIEGYIVVHKERRGDERRLRCFSTPY